MRFRFRPLRPSAALLALLLSLTPSIARAQGSSPDSDPVPMRVPADSEIALARQMLGMMDMNAVMRAQGRGDVTARRQAGR